MRTRLVLLLLVLCLPMRLWAGVGLMLNSAANESVETAWVRGGGQTSVHGLDHSQMDHHHGSAVSAVDGHSAAGAGSACCTGCADDSSASHDCRICMACHMPALHAWAAESLPTLAERGWRAQAPVLLAPEPLQVVFKPPVS